MPHFPPGRRAPPGPFPDLSQIPPRPLPDPSQIPHKNCCLGLPTKVGPSLFFMCFSQSAAPLQEQLAVWAQQLPHAICL